MGNDFLGGLAGGLAVFAMTKLTDTLLQVPEAGNDNHIMIQGSAATWSAITSDTFLPDPKPGQDQLLVRTGDQTAKVAVGQSLNEIQQKLWTHVYDNDEVRELDQNRTTTIQKDDKLIVIGNRNVEITKNRDTRIKENDSLAIEGNRTVKVTKKRDTKIKEDDALQIGGNHSIVVDKEQHTTVKKKIAITSAEDQINIEAATNISLKVGKSTLTMDKDGNIRLNGIDLMISGEKILSAASEVHTIRGEKLVEINP